MKRGGDRAAAFTLVELILVMALLALLMAFSAPLLSRSLRQRGVAGEAARFLALTEYGRSEAISRGIPMVVWIEPAARRFGAEPKAGFEIEEARGREFGLDPDITIEVPQGTVSRGIVQAVEFSPDGAPSVGSVEEVRFADRFGSVTSVTRSSDGWRYEIAAEARSR
jgi:prepilin-type N-terminal cleavage/methylation domain-containing protein